MTSVLQSNAAGSTGHTPRPRQLPQLQGGLFLTDGGLETTAIFHDGMDLPYNAAFILLRDAAGRRWLREYFERYAQIAMEVGSGFILETPTWRASPDWASRIGIGLDELDRLNADAVTLMREVACGFPASMDFVISGCIGPRRDGYAADLNMTADQAERYHARQIQVFAAARVNLVTAITMTNPAEAIGIARAAHSAGVPAVISFTVETDGRLPSGHTLQQAIALVDALAEAAPAYYMINCAHPTHFAQSLADDGPKGERAWIERIRGLRANSSCLSHAQLDESPVLDEGDPAQLGREHQQMLRRHRHINVLGGCCGTDHRHVGSIARACVADSSNDPALEPRTDA